VCESAGPLQLSKNCILVSEQITHKTVVVTFIHTQSRLLAWTENAGGKGGRESSNVGFIRRSKLDETSEMGTDRVEGGDVCKTKLSEC
jgi:hypothetical protein